MAIVCACSNQGEGEICDPDAGNAGNNDCQSGLVCTKSTLPGVEGFRCCPSDLTTAKTAVCSISHGVADASPAPPDGGPEPEAASVDAPIDVPTEVAKEATTDSPVDSPEDSLPEAAADVGAAATDASDAPAD
ncbi:MAG: hypothetical protein ACLP1X_17825 [Polyangiaceae bacterium]|jgi:hypothetical protein